MIEDYKAWFEQHSDLLSHLYHHQSLIFDRISDVLKVMTYVKNSPEKEIDADLEVAFDVGFSYLFHRVEEIKLYLEQQFNGNLHEMLHFDALINYALYLEDLRDTCQEQEALSDEVRTGLDEIENRIDAILTAKQPVSDDVIDEFNVILLSIIPSHREFLTIPEVYTRIVEELEKES